MPITSISMSVSILCWHPWPDLFKCHMDVFNQTTSNVFSKLLVSTLQSILTMNLILNKHLHSNFSCHISQRRKVSLDLYSWVWWSTKPLQLHILPPKCKNLPMQSMPSSLLIWKARSITKSIFKLQHWSKTFCQMSDSFLRHRMQEITNPWSDFVTAEKLPHI